MSSFVLPGTPARSRSFAALLVTTALVSFASTALADGATPERSEPRAAASPSSRDSAPAPPAAADMVRLRGGGMLRGTISELVPAGDVVLITITGELRRIPMREVEYAGPVTGAPSEKPSLAAAPAPSAVSADAPPANVPVAVTANEKNITLHVRSGSASGTLEGHRVYRVALSEYQELCVAPCTSALATGGHTLAASLPGGRLVTAAEPVDVRGPSKLDIDYTSKHDLRAAGAVTAIIGHAGMFIGSYVAITSSSASCTINYHGPSSCTEDDTPKYALGAAIAGGLAGTVGLLIAILAKDSVEFTLTPNGSSSPGASGPAGTAGGAKDTTGASHAALRLSPSGIGIAF